MQQKHVFTFLLCFLFCFSRLCGQSDFSRLLDLEWYDANLSPSLPNGDFLIAGDRGTGPQSQLVVTRIDAAGQTQASWQLNTTPAMSFVRPLGLTELADGHVTMLGRGVLNQIAHDFICILDSSGQIDAAQQFSSGYATIVEATTDSGLVVGGNDVANQGTFFMNRYDKQLNLIWNYEFILPSNNTALRDLVLLPDGSVVLAGETDITSNHTPIFVIHVDAQGGVKWAKKYSSSNLSFGHNSIHYGGGDKLFLSATSDNPATFTNQMAILCIDTAGNYLWGNTVENPNGRSAFTNNMIAGYGGTWILYGIRNGTGAFDEGMAAAFTSTGSLLWSRNMSFLQGYENLQGVVQHPDGGYLWLINQGQRKRIIKTDSLGLMTLPCGPFPLNAPTTAIQLSAAPLTLSVSAGGPTSTPLTISSQSTVIGNSPDCFTLGTRQPDAPLHAQVLPQPLVHSGRIQLSEPKLNAKAQLHVTDLSGRHMSLPSTRLPDGWEIQRGDLPAGIYAYQVLQGGQRIASGKLWVAD